MRTVAFRTAKGSSIELTILTETPNLADHHVTNPCYELRLEVNARPIHGGVDRIDHLEHGPSLKPYFCDAIIPIPADQVAAVDALLLEYGTERDCRLAVISKADAEYERDYAAICKLLDQ